MATNRHVKYINGIPEPAYSLLKNSYSESDLGAMKRLFNNLTNLGITILNSYELLTNINEFTFEYAHFNNDSIQKQIDLLKSIQNDPDYNQFKESLRPFALNGVTL